MGRRKKEDMNQTELPPIHRAIDPEAREKQLIALSMNEAEKQLREGRASSQVICHFLKLATVEKQLEMEKLKKENKLLDAKTNAIESQVRTEQLFQDAIDAMKSYSGHKED